MCNQIIHLLISLSVFFSCEEGPMEDILIEEQLECKPLIVSDSIFNGYYFSDTTTSNPIEIHERIYQNDTYSVSSILGMQGQCFTVPIRVTNFSQVNIRLVWNGQFHEDTATFLFVMYGKYAPNNLAVLKLMKNPHEIDTVAKVLGKSDFVVRILYNKSNGIWQERIVDVELN